MKTKSDLKAHMVKLILFAGVVTLIQLECAWTEEIVERPQQTLKDYISKEINTLDQAVNTSSSESSVLGAEDENEGYFFRRFWLRLRPRVERDIPIFASFSVVPEIQLLWEKQTPQNWEIYKPKH